MPSHRARGHARGPEPCVANVLCGAEHAVRCVLCQQSAGIGRDARLPICIVLSTDWARKSSGRRLAALPSMLACWHVRRRTSGDGEEQRARRTCRPESTSAKLACRPHIAEPQPQARRAQSPSGREPPPGQTLLLPGAQELGLRFVICVQNFVPAACQMLAPPVPRAMYPCRPHQLAILQFCDIIWR